MEGHQKFLGKQGAKILEAQYEAKLEFPGGGGVQNEKPSMGGVWIFSRTAQWAIPENIHTQQRTASMF